MRCVAHSLARRPNHVLSHPKRSDRGALRISWFSSATENDSNASTRNLVSWKISDENPHIGLLTLQSAATYNALTVEMGHEFSEVVQHVRQNVLTNHDVRAIVLTGEGTNAFSAGGNLQWLRALKNNSVHANADLMMSFYNSFLCIRQVPVPVVANLLGPAVGAGAGLALACDMRVGVANKPRLLGLNFTRLGIHSGMGGSHFLKLALPSTTAANEILLTGKTLSGQEAFDLGLLNRLAANEEECLSMSMDLATEMTKQHPVALRMLLQTLRAQQDDGLQQALQREALAQAICYNRQDWPEGVNATAEKRAPEFDGYHEP